MRTLLVVSTVVLLSGCAGLPAPDPNLAWIDLAPGEDDTLHAVEVDERAWADKRYFEVPPGSHELTVRYLFAVTPSNIGPVEEPLWRDCQLNVKFKDFSAGQRYQLEAVASASAPGPSSMTNSAKWSAKASRRAASVPKGVNGAMLMLCNPHVGVRHAPACDAARNQYPGSLR